MYSDDNSRASIEQILEASIDRILDGRVDEAVRLLTDVCPFRDHCRPRGEPCCVEILMGRLLFMSLKTRNAVYDDAYRRVKHHPHDQCDSQPSPSPQ